MIDCHQCVCFIFYQFKAVWKFVKESDGVFCPPGFSQKSRMFSRALVYIQGPERAVWGPKSQIRVTNGIFWTIGVLAKQISRCVSQVSTLFKAYFDRNFSLKIWREDWKGKKLCCTIIGFRGSWQEAETFCATESQLGKKLNLNLKKTESQIGKKWISTWKKTEYQLEKNWISTWKKLKLNLKKTESQLGKKLNLNLKKININLDKTEYQLGLREAAQ